MSLGQSLKFSKYVLLYAIYIFENLNQNQAVEFEKESNNVIKFKVPTKSVARILGRGGANINEIKDETGAQIDVDKSSEDPQNTDITCRGTKKAIASAKAAIMIIVDQVGQETTVTINIERKFHRTIIGAGGQGLRELVNRCGGPSDPKQQASLIRLYVYPCYFILSVSYDLVPAPTNLSLPMKFASAVNLLWSRRYRQSWKRLLLNFVTVWF